MNDAESIFESFRRLAIPDARDYDLSTPQGKEGFIDAWYELATSSDSLVKDCVRYLALHTKPSNARLLRKLSKHLERCRKLGENTHANWHRAIQWHEQSNLNAAEIVWTIFGNKTEKEKWSVTEQRAINAETNRCNKLHDIVLRERELLLVEIDAVSPSGSA